MIFSISKRFNLLFIVLIFLSRSVIAAGTGGYSSLSAYAPRPIGNYSNGCIKGTQMLEINGEGYQVMRLSRERYFGHPDLVSFIRYLGRTVKQQGLGTMLVGDMSQARGGPMPSGHRSHQIGLDADIWFWLDSPANDLLLSDEARESLSAPSMVHEKLMVLNTQRWQPENTAVLKHAALHPAVDRIFVNPAIKQHLCDTLEPNEKAWLHKIRPWWHHADHFHVRLKCPPNQPQCLNQPPVESGPGCDDTLAEWFKPQPPPVITKKPVPKPLPEECIAFLNE